MRFLCALEFILECVFLLFQIKKGGENMIKINNVHKSFNNVQVLKDITLEIKKGEVFGLVGHSGAGKSTLLRCINGLETYDKGSILVNEYEEVKNLTNSAVRSFRKNLGMIFQHFSLLERRNVYDNVALPLECWGYSKADIDKRVIELLELVGLSDKKKSKPRELSGGQKQRVAIARALALNPNILLCDEATSALDPNTTKSILALLRDINEKLGITIIIVTHQMEVVKEICERVAIMEGGQVMAVGKTEDLFLKNSKSLKALIGEEEILPSEGINIRLFFPKDNSNDSIITGMARELDIDFSIVWGKLERFRDDVLGSLVINIKQKQKDEVVKYLTSKEMPWEVI